MTWIDPDFPKRATPSDRVGRVLGLNPGMMTGPGTNTYLVGRSDPVLIDTGAGVPGYMGVLEDYLGERGWHQPSRVILTHRHRDHLGGVPHLRERFPGLSVSKMIHRDTDLPAGTADLRDGQVVKGDGVTSSPSTRRGTSDHCALPGGRRALFQRRPDPERLDQRIPDEDGDLVDYGVTAPRAVAGRRRIYPAHGPVIEDAPRRSRSTSTIGWTASARSWTARQRRRTIPRWSRSSMPTSREAHAMAGMSVHSPLKKLKKDGRVGRRITARRRGGPCSVSSCVTHGTGSG